MTSAAKPQEGNFASSPGARGGEAGDRVLFDREWQERGARLVGDLAIVTARGQNTAEFRRRVYARMGLTLREVRL